MKFSLKSLLAIVAIACAFLGGAVTGYEYACRWHDQAIGYIVELCDHYEDLCKQMGDECDASLIELEAMSDKEYSQFETRLADLKRKTALLTKGEIE